MNSYNKSQNERNESSWHCVAELRNEWNDCNQSWLDEFI